MDLVTKTFFSWYDHLQVNFSSMVFFSIFIWALLKHYAFTLVYKLPDYFIQFKIREKEHPTTLEILNGIAINVLILE